MNPLKAYNEYTEKIAKVFIESFNHMRDEVSDLIEAVHEDIGERDYMVYESESEDGDEIKLRTISEKDIPFFFTGAEGFNLENYKGIVIVDNYYKHDAYAIAVGTDGDILFTNRVRAFSKHTVGDVPLTWIKGDEIFRDTLRDNNYLLLILSVVLETVYKYDKETEDEVI